MFLNKLFLSSLLFSVSAFSQVDLEKKSDTIKNNDLDEVVVTATRTKRQLSSVPMPVTLISKKQIQRSGSVRLRDILLEQTGITIVQDVGNSEGVQLQGVAADYTLIMIDGVPIVGRVAGNIDLNRITVNNIKQIEVVKGPSSALYGSEAMGGVINIITEKPLRESLDGQFHVLTRGGGRNELDVNSNFTYRRNKVGLVVGVNLNSSGGFDLTPLSSSRTVNPHQNYTFNSRYLYDISESLEFDLSGRYYNQEQYVGEMTNTQTDWNFNALLRQKISDKWDVTYTFYGTQFKTISALNGDTAENKRTLLRPEIRTQYNFEKWGTLIGGFGGNLDKLDRNSINGEKQFQSWYAYGQYDFNPISTLNVVLGARYEGSDSYQSAFSPKVSASYKLNDKLTFKGSVGYGFKIPDFRQLYFDFRNVNNGYIVLGTYTVHNLFDGLTDLSAIQRELKTESSIGYNFGFQWKPIDGLKVNVNGFRNNIKDLIDTFDTQLPYDALGLPQGTRTFSYRNISSVYTQGIELDINYRFNKNIRLLAGYQFLDTGSNEDLDRIDDGIFYRDSNGISQELQSSSYFGLANRSRHMINARIFYDNYKHKFSVSLRGTYRSEFAPFDSNANSVIDGFDNFVKPNTQVNLAVNKTLFSTINLQLGIDNLFNETGIENKELFNFTDTNGNIIANDAYLQLGRTIFGRIQINI
ncbi:outer membrane receptor for ferrienterochelin and colicins [Tenacibaculum sp. MAR_2009_124]|uniref:TonB-dependent receptor plug domain-containing protein n=1 Tax=Tenacibaculum sp. MAR_2009_124 TaxID=1250059 RepID=UPI0008974941|nr:TonB-dependent receptor [Tenacibaculum sp. MAR_2009_124]SEB36425.1 outer membrane receptor for ferrienterochelin and colicins [Tenacibaculum sp. MAR_2009_124]